MPRVFNALAGHELRQIVVKEVQQQIELDARFQRDDPIVEAVMVFTLAVQSYPSDEQPFNIHISKVFKGPAGETLTPEMLKKKILGAIDQEFSLDLRFGVNLTYLKVTCNHRIELTLKRPGGTVVTERALPPVQDDERHFDLRGPSAASAPVNIQASSSAAADGFRGQRIASLRAELAALEAGGGPVRPQDVVPEPMTSHTTVHEGIARRPYDPHTETGLELERGWKPSPGAGMAGSWGGGAAVGAVQNEGTVEERIALGTEHPPLDEGGMGKADAVRREHGLNVPETQTRGNQTFDIPAGSF